MATQAEVLQRVGEDLGLVSIGQPLEAQDQARVSSAYDDIYAKLQTKGLAGWTTNIPESVVPYLCLLIEEKLLIPFSVPENRALRVKVSAGDDGALALLKLAELMVPEYLSTDTDQDY